MTETKATHGGPRSGAGRPIGSVSIRENAAQKARIALDALAQVAADAQAPAEARVHAAQALLDAARASAKEA
ncbi:MAG: hypothetical protein KAX47_01570 [Zoogloea sp.]|jgi:hypothetical protein|nr:hypothetical protein [Zoogloea sp.]